MNFPFLITLSVNIILLAVETWVKEEINGHEGGHCNNSSKHAQGVKQGDAEDTGAASMTGYGGEEVTEVERITFGVLVSYF